MAGHGTVQTAKMSKLCAFCKRGYGGGPTDIGTYMGANIPGVTTRPRPVRKECWCACYSRIGKRNVLGWALRAALGVSSSDLQFTALTKTALLLRGVLTFGCSILKDKGRLLWTSGAAFPQVLAGPPALRYEGSPCKRLG